MKKLISFITVLTILTIYVVPYFNVSASTLTQSELNGYIGAMALTELVLGGQADSIDISTHGWAQGSEEFVETLGDCIMNRDYSSLSDFGIDIVREAIRALDTQIVNEWGYKLYQQGQDLITVDGKECFQLLSDTLAFVPSSMKDILSGYVEEEPYEPPADYTSYINFIMNNPTWQSLNYTNSLRYSWENYSFLWAYWRRGAFQETYSGNYFHPDATNCYFVPVQPIDVYINEVNGYWYITHSAISPEKDVYAPNQQSFYDTGLISYDSNLQNYIVAAGYDSSNIYSFNYFFWVQSSYISLQSALLDLQNYVSHCNIYVNGVQWTNVSSGNNQYPINFGDLMTLYNDYPTMYYYPSPSFIDIDGLYQMIIDAINNSDIITYNDIKPFILDVNGQEAVATVNIVRTDYDKLIQEQYPIYITNKNTQLQQPLDLLEESKDYIQYIANNAGSDLIPEDILQVISVCGIVILVGYLINRMLE